ncbi:MAG: hypothetical protein R2792_14645 [Saprospiraceae bacterium]
MVASGISLGGDAIYHGAFTWATDAAAHEMLDRFGGHTDGTELPTISRQKTCRDHIHPHESGHSALMGYMLDGFGIYGFMAKTANCSLRKIWMNVDTHPGTLGWPAHRPLPLPLDLRFPLQHWLLQGTPQ